MPKPAKQLVDGFYELDQGKNSICTCGLSKVMPWCDGSVKFFIN